MLKATPSDEAHCCDQRVPCSQVTQQTPGQWGRGQILPVTFPVRKDFPGARHRWRYRQTDPGCMLASLWKTNVKHYFVCLATAAPKFLETANNLQLSCPWKLPGFMQKTKHHMLLGWVKPTPSANQNFVTWTQKQVTSLETKTTSTIFFLHDKLYLHYLENVSVTPLLKYSTLAKT